MVSMRIASLGKTLFQPLDLLSDLAPVFLNKLTLSSSKFQGSIHVVPGKLV